MCTVQRWDAGDAGCGALILALHQRVSALGPEETLEVVARGSGARHDIPAWCRMTGHRLIASAHPIYTIRRREE